MSFYRRRRYRGFGALSTDVLQSDVNANPGIATALRVLGRLQPTNFFDPTPAQEILNLTVNAYEQWLVERNLASGPTLSSGAKLQLYAEARAKKEADAAAEKQAKDEQAAKEALVYAANRAAVLAPAPTAVTAVVAAPAPIVASFVPNIPVVSFGPGPTRPTGQLEVIPGSTEPLNKARDLEDRKRRALAEERAQALAEEKARDLEDQRRRAFMQEKAQALAKEKARDQQTGGGGGGWTRPPPATAWDQREEVEEVILDDGTTVAVPKKSPQFITMTGGAVGGLLLLGGPLGMLLGAAVGYFISKPKVSQVSRYRSW